MAAASPFFFERKPAECEAPKYQIKVPYIKYHNYIEQPIEKMLMMKI